MFEVWELLTCTQSWTVFFISALSNSVYLSTSRLHIRYTIRNANILCRKTGFHEYIAVAVHSTMHTIGTNWAGVWAGDVASQFLLRFWKWACKPEYAQMHRLAKRSLQAANKMFNSTKLSLQIQTSKHKCTKLRLYRYKILFPLTPFWMI